MHRHHVRSLPRQYRATPVNNVRRIDLETGALRIRQARVDVNGRDMIVPTKTDRSARDLPVPPRELAMLKAVRAVHLRERLAVGRPLADTDLLLSRADGTPLPVRDYSRELADQRNAAGLKAITLGKLRHSKSLGCARPVSPPT